MKKNKMMRVASALLVAVLMTTSVISGTFAKYVTQDKASDEARVAKWGVELQVVGKLFGETYKDAIVANDAGSFTVQAKDYVSKDDYVVAPGTKNENGFTISLKGQPEVAGKVTTTMKVQNIFLAAGTYGVMIPVDEGLITAANFDEFVEVAAEELYYADGSNFVKAATWLNDWNTTPPSFYTLEDKVTLSGIYYPVVYTLKDGATKIASGDTTADSLKVVADKIADAAYLGLTAGTPATDTSITYTGTPKEFTANTDLAGWNCDNLKLTWEWAIGTEDNLGTPENEAVTAVDNGADTILGNLMAGTKVVVKEGETYKTLTVTDGIVKNGETVVACLNTMFDISITVEQVD